MHPAASDPDDRRAVESKDAPEPIGPYSQALVAGGVLYCSGQVPLDPESGELIEGGIAKQARRCLESLAAICEAAGTRLESAARITIYLTEMADFPAVNEVYAEFFSEPFPVRSTVGVAALPKGAAVEMDATVPLAGKGS
jgi:2-iminobutanoate/2-iminopropanoate deaminase